MSLETNLTQQAESQSGPIWLRRDVDGSRSTSETKISVAPARLESSEPSEGVALDATVLRLRADGKRATPSGLRLGELAQNEVVLRQEHQGIRTVFGLLRCEHQECTLIARGRVTVE